MTREHLLAYRYELQEFLGQGHSSTVYLAHDTIIDGPVVIKILDEKFSDEDYWVARFRLEALSIARLHHPNIVMVYDTGVSDGKHFFVQQYFDGAQSAAARLKKNGPFGSTAAAQIGVQVVDALRVVHAEELFHRDVKPCNIILSGKPHQRGGLHARLADFVASKLRNRRVTF